MGRPMTRHYDTARVQAELEGKTHYPGGPCKADPEHVRGDGTSLRDTVKYRCLLCRQAQAASRNQRRREKHQSCTQAPKQS